MKKWLFLLLLAAALGGGVYYWWFGARTQPLSEKTLTFADVRPVTIRDIVSATGLVEPHDIVVVSSDGAGTLMNLKAHVGDLVMEGEELAQLDDRRIVLKIEEARNGIQMADAAYLQAQAALAQAHANRDAAFTDLTAKNDLKKLGGFRSDQEQAKAQYDAALAGVKAAEAGIEVVSAKKQTTLTALKEAELAREMTRIKVPGSSQASLKRMFLILDRKVQVGQMVGPQSGPLFTLAGSLDTVEVHAQVAEGDINKIRKKYNGSDGMKAVFTVMGFSDNDIEFQGFVKEIRPQASSIKGAVYYDTIITVQNRKDPITNEWQLRPGMTASVDIIRREHKDAWRVPSAALNFTLDEAYQSESAKASVAAWKQRPDARDWQTLWVWNEATHQPQPVFVRIGGVNASGEAGLKDSEGNEILEWEPGKQPAQMLRVIIGAPPARAPGLFDQPANVKI